MTVAGEVPGVVPAEPAAPPEATRWLERLGLTGVNAYLLAGLFLLAFVLRYYSPILPNFLTGDLSHGFITNCVSSTPVTPDRKLGTLCGLAYPFQGATGKDANGNPQPPEGEIFDEIYFAVFAHDDLKGIAYFDPEPPLSKLLIASGEYGWGLLVKAVTGSPANPADLGFNTFGWRLMPCLFGSLAVPLMFLLAFQLWRNRLFAILAAILTCFDGMFFIQSRIGMIDIFPIFLIMLAYLLLLVHLRSPSPRAAMVTQVLLGIALGLAIAAKWISLAAWAVALFFIAGSILLPFLRVSLNWPGGSGWSWGGGVAPSESGRPAPAGRRPAVPGGARLLPYLGLALLSFVAIPLVIYVVSWIPFFMRGQFHNLHDLWKYQVDSYEYHAHLTATHPYGSPWFSWPFLYRPVAYYFESGSLGTDPRTGEALVAGMHNLGNPIIWWLSIPCVVALVYFVLRHRSFPAAVILVGFVTQYLPFARVTRVMFLYHMFGGLIFMILALSFVLAWMAQGGLRVQVGTLALSVPGRLAAYTMIVLAVAFFVYFYPVWTGAPVTSSGYLGGFGHGRMWFPSWI